MGNNMQSLDDADSSSIKILAFGDSMTHGYYKYGTAYHPYSIMLQKLLREKFGNHIVVQECGQDGEQTCEMKHRIKEVLAKNKFQFGILFGGLNDLGFVKNMC